MHRCTADIGKSYKSDDSILENYYSYGKDILAARDGVVVKVCNKHLDKLNATSEDELTNPVIIGDVIISIGCYIFSVFHIFQPLPTKHFYKMAIWVIYS